MAKRRYDWCGSKLRDARVAAGLTQAALAERMDPRRARSIRTCISRWESDTHPPAATSLLALCRILGVEPATLYA